MYFPWHVIGHERQKQEIENNILKNNLSHAYLFSGPKDIGKFQFANEIALALLCPNKMCRTCSICRQITNLTHSDLLVIDKLYIDKTSTDFEKIAKSTNISQQHRISHPIKTDTITIDDIRELQKKLQEKPISKYKICLISNIDRINIEATNAFLKSVEEPYQKTIFIFTTSKESLLLQTFLSRLRIIRFNLLNNNVILEQIKESTNKEEILEYSQGRIIKALNIAKNPDKLNQTRKLFEYIKDIYENFSTGKQFVYASSIYQNQEEINSFIEYSYFYLRSKIKPDNKAVALMIEILDETEQLMKKNVNKRLLLENFFIQINRIKSNFNS